MVIRSHKSEKGRQHNIQIKTNKQLPKNKTSQTKIAIQQQGLPSKYAVNSDAPEKEAVPALSVASIELFLYMMFCY